MIAGIIVPRFVVDFFLKLLMIATFPGMILREAVMYITCKGLQMEAQIRFTVSKLLYVEYKSDSKFKKNIVNLIPFLINSAGGIAVIVFFAGTKGTQYTTLWLMASAAIHAFPPSGYSENKTLFGGIYAIVIFYSGLSILIFK